MNLKEHRRRVLKKLRFVKIEGGSHEKWVFPKDTKKVKTYASRGNKDIGHGLMKTIRVQMHITKQQYQNIASCSMSKESYYKYLVDIGIF